eukprot:m.169912 g.169912  ORF g.169912 m.169912 type:complete len:101 (-) comp24179_c0_seq4:720-1022(-)
MQIQHPAWRSQPKKSDEEKEERGLGRKRQTALDLYLERFEKRGRQVAPQCLVFRTVAILALILWIMAVMWIAIEKKIGRLEAVLSPNTGGGASALPRPSP